MPVCNRKLVLLSGALAVLPVLAIAETAGDKPAADAATTTTATTTATSAAGTAPAAARSDDVGILAAIEAAKARIDGGLLEAELDNERGQRVYEIDLAADDGIQEVTVDAATGEVLSLDEKTLAGLWADWFNEDRLQGAAMADANLAEILGKVQGETDGWITEISLDDEDGRMVYEFEVETADGEREGRVDVTTGAVTFEDD